MELKRESDGDVCEDGVLKSVRGLIKTSVIGEDRVNLKQK